MGKKILITLQSTIPQNLRTEGNPRLTPLRPVHAAMLAHKITPLNFPETVRKGAHALMGRCTPEIRFPSSRSFPLHAHVPTMPQGTKKVHPEQISTHMKIKAFIEY